MSREETRSRLIELLEPMVEGLGFELVDLEYYSGRQGKIFMVIDSKNAVTIDNCEEISRAASSLLDLHDPLPHAYLLEVASPGLERPLTKPLHFNKFKGEPVKIVLQEEIGGSIKVAGIIRDADEKKVIIDREDGTETTVNFKQIKKARLWFRKPDRARKKTK